MNGRESENVCVYEWVRESVCEREGERESAFEREREREMKRFDLLDAG